MNVYNKSILYNSRSSKTGKSTCYIEKIQHSKCQGVEMPHILTA